MTEIVFWQEALSIHRAPVIRELSKMAGLHVSAVSFDSVSSARQAMGWDAPNYGKANVQVVDPADWKEAAVAHVDADVHVFAGFGAWPGLREAQTYLTKNSAAAMYVLTEPWDDRGFKGFLRMLRAGRRVRRIGPNLAGVLPCGSRAKAQLLSFRALRSKPSYDFGYFVDASEASLPSPSEDTRLIYVGALEEWKAPLLLIQALANLRDWDWQLEMYGEGDQASAVQREIGNHGLAERIRLHDYQPHSVIRGAIAASDLLILPSAHDGWGAVVNEALMDGTRVVVSDAAGASDLVTDETLGGCFRTGDRASLEKTLQEALTYGHSHDARRAIRAWANSTIAPAAAADYLKAILLQHPQPVPAPWHEVLPSFQG